MNKPEFIKLVAENLGATMKDTEPVVNAVFDTIGDVLKSGDKVKLVGFGTFEAKDRTERKGINPVTKESITIASRKLPTFKAGSELKEMVN